MNIPIQGQILLLALIGVSGFVLLSNQIEKETQLRRSEDRHLNRWLLEIDPDPEDEDY